MSYLFERCDMAIEQKILDAAALFHEFELNKEAALAKYNQTQEIKVSGRIKVAVKGKYILLDGGVRCQFDSPFYPPKARRDQRILVTGFVTGFEVHVDMEHCAVL